ncbi:MAG: hypothetical protein JNJ46_12745 [Myxococcales bacterium]|nr:hypothetical protein [Myxococcales bacterium]
MDPKATYIPALRFSFLTRLYDPLMRVTLKEEKFKRKLVEQASIQSGQRVLDLGPRPLNSGGLDTWMRQS